MSSDFFRDPEHRAKSLTMQTPDKTMSNETKPTIALTPVESSQIKAIGHDAATNTLAVEFNSGGVYHYSGFDAEKFAAFKNAPSVGSHFYKHIKGKFPYTKQ